MPGLECLMCAIAEGRRLGLLALAEGDLFLFRYGELDRREAGSFVGSVTKRLVLGAPALTPVVGSRFQRQHSRLLGCNEWFLHQFFSFVWMIELIICSATLLLLDHVSGRGPLPPRTERLRCPPDHESLDSSSQCEDLSHQRQD